MELDGLPGREVRGDEPGAEPREAHRHLDEHRVLGPAAAVERVPDRRAHLGAPRPRIVGDDDPGRGGVRLAEHGARELLDLVGEAPRFVRIAHVLLPIFDAVVSV